MSTHRTLVAAALALLMAACRSTPTPPASTAPGGDSALAANAWVLVEIVEGEATSEPRINSVTVAFTADGKASFTLDCNRGSGTWTVGPGKGELRFGPLATTRAECPPGGVGDAVAHAMADVVAYEVYDGRLTLRTASGVQYVWDHID